MCDHHRILDQVRDLDANLPPLSCFVSAGTDLAADFNKDVRSTELVQTLDQTIDCVALGECGQIDLQLGNRFTQGRRVHLHG